MIKFRCLRASLWVLLCLLIYQSSCYAVTVQVRVNNNNDDAEERISDGDMYRGSSDLELGYDTFVGGLQIVGMRFRNVNIPQGATINSAYVEFEVDETNSGTTNLLIYGQDIDDAARFGNNDNNISIRTKTTQSVTWSPSAWNSRNQKQQTPDISSIVEEIVGRSGWAANNDMVILVEPGSGCTSSSCRRTAESYNGERAAAPLLVVDYTEGGATLSGDVHVDNQFTAYISTSDSVQGTQIGTGNVWTNSYNFSTNLSANQTYYLHVFAQDTGGPAGFLGDFSLTGNSHQFENGTTTLLTNSTNWRVSQTGWSSYVSATDFGQNGTSPWGTRAAVDSNARWIWSSDNNSHNTVYFTTTIRPAASYSVSSVHGACGTDNLLVVEYDSAIDSSALDVNYYSLNTGTVTSVTQQSSTVVVLAISGVTAGGSYVLTVNGSDHNVDFTGLTGHYFDQRDSGGTKVGYPSGVLTGNEYLRKDSDINFSWDTATPTIFTSGSGNNDRFSVQWQGYVVPSQDGDYEFRLYSDDGMRMSLDGTQLLNDWSNHSPRYTGASATQTLSSGVGYPLTIEYFENYGRAYAWLEWRRDGGAWQTVPTANLSSCAATSVASNPVIEYRMDENEWSGATDEVVDSSGNNHHGIAQNDLSTDSDGHICRAGNFDGVDDYVQDSVIGSTLTGTSSLSFWIKTTQTGNNTGWRAPGIAGVEQAGGSDDIFWGWIDASGNIGLSVGNDYSSKSTTAINDGAYHHVVLTRNATSGAYKIYIDGSLNRSGTIGSGVIGNSFSSIGRIEDTGGSPEYFQGLLDEVKIYDQVLTDAQVTTIYNETRTCTDLILDLRMESGAWNGTAGEVIDSSASGYHGRAVNGATTNTATPAIAGDPGTCRYGEFDDAGGANGDYIELTSFPNLTTNFTMTSWIRTTDRTQRGQRIFADDESNSGGFAISLGDPGSGRLRFYSRGVSPVSMDSGSVISNDTWYFVAAIADITNSERTLYVFDTSGNLLSTTNASYSGAWGTDNGVATVGGESNSGETANRFRGNLDEVRVYNGVLDVASISSILNQTHPCTSSCTLSSFTLTSPASAIACPTTRAEIGIQANCSGGGVFEGTVDLSTNESTSGLVEFYETAGSSTAITSLTFTASDAGSKSAHLFYKNERTDLTVTVDDQASSVTATTSAITFAAQGFVVASTGGDTNNVCGSYASSMRAYSLTAFGQRNDGSGACQIISGFTGAKTLSAYHTVAYDQDTPTQGASNAPLLLRDQNASTNLDINAGSTAGSPDSISLQFNAGVASFNVDMEDAGQVGGVYFNHTHAVSGDTLSGTIPTFVSLPKSIQISTSSSCAGPPTTQYEDCSVFETAGRDFAMTARAVCEGGATATSYQLRSGESIELTHNLLAPSSNGDAGELEKDEISIGASDNGEATESAQQISEVGVFTIISSPPDYFSQQVDDSTSAPIGRFIPASFSVTFSPQAVEFTPGCSAAGAYHYLNQSFTWANAPQITIQALNANGDVTTNYEGAFWKLGSELIRDCDGAADDNGFCYSDNAGVANVGLVTPGASTSYGTPSTIATIDGQLAGLAIDHGGNANFNYQRSSGDITPFQANVDLTINLYDEDDVTGSASLTGISFASSAPLRHGRWKMENAFGPETRSLAMLSYPQYYDGSRFVINTDDQCTALDNIRYTPSSGSQTPVVSGNTLSVNGTTTTTITLNSPVSDSQGYNFNFSAPGAGETGSFDMNVNLSSFPWLRYDWDNNGTVEDHPDTTVQFGQFRGNDRVIYWRGL